MVHKVAMAQTIKSVISATGSYIPELIVKNEEFINHDFYEKDGIKINRNNTEIISKFLSITDIEERRYASDAQNSSELGFLAAKNALESSTIDAESLDYIIVAHNFGDVKKGNNRTDMVPTLASRIKHKLGIKNVDCVAYDLPFGCPGWLQGVIQADYFIRSGDAKNILIIGSETISRVIDPHDRDSMIYSDGAGAVILSAEETEERIGILAHKAQTHTQNEAWYLRMEGSSKEDYEAYSDIFLKMDGRKVYEYALKNVPLVMQTALEKAGLKPQDVNKVLVHQANGKMDEAILKRFFKLYNIDEAPADIMPMSIAKLGNSSVATIPTLLDLILKGEFKDHQINKGDVVLFTSVGAGMNINAVVYKF